MATLSPFSARILGANSDARYASRLYLKALNEHVSEFNVGVRTTWHLLRTMLLLGDDLTLRIE
jgi:hypothetical protein